ncbi:VanZ like family protein [Pseudonocardia ammonioxydans]|uniref:VanZ like family protein n=1 Tax=Pseudonocardia ammonioxydans TaxID=260086 RepID=A0A1I5EJU6_PSUAM|nr:VanZ family protein [Pseudonocardia ammonioxydans]SFO11802.1 VanZ like family protein [Pseudonocardia ammonioxydans]
MRVQPFVLAVLLSLGVLFTPASGVPVAPPGTDKLVHLGVFALLAVTGRIAEIRTWPLLGGLAVYAAASEVLQAVLPLGRSGDLVDGLVDVAGAALGLVLYAAVARRRSAA